MDSTWKHRLTAIVILIAGIAAAWLIIAVKPDPEPESHHEMPPHLAEVITVALETRPVKVFSQGSVTPRTKINITSQVSGEVVSVSDNFVAGGIFAAGQTLLEIDPRDYEIALVRAEATLAETKNILAQEQGLAAQAKREWRDLGSEAANELFLRKPQLEAAKANVRAAEAGVRKAELDLQRTRIAVPFDGRVTSVDANPGQYVNSGATLGSVYASRIMEVRLPLSVSELRLLNLGAATATRELPALAVDFSLGTGDSAMHWPGKVVRLEASVDPKSRLFYLVAAIAGSAEEDGSGQHGAILPGTFVEAVITSNPHTDVAVLPRSGLYQTDQVFSLDDDNRLHLQTVKVLQVDSDSLVVQGLKSGQQVLARPPGFMDLGAVYTVVPVAAAENH